MGTAVVVLLLAALAAYVEWVDADAAFAGGAWWSPVK